VSARLFRALLAGVALVAMALVVTSTFRGPGVGGDATIYMTSARNLLDGKGLGLVGPRGEFRLLPYFPPFFPFVLSAAGLLGLDLEFAARWLNILLFGGLVALVGEVTLRAAHSRILALLAAVLLALSPVLIPVYSWAMSEPLAIFTGFAGLVLALRAVRAPDPRPWALLGGLVLGLSVLTRYSSAAYLGAGLLALLVYLPGGWKRRLWNGILLLAAGTAPAAAWVVYDLRMTAAVASRSMESGGGMAARLAGLPALLEEVVLFWLVPDSWVSNPPYPAALNRLLVIAAVLLFLAAAGLVLLRAARRNPSLLRADAGMLAVTLGLFIMAYLAELALVYITTYPPITIGSRMLSPVHAAVLWLAVVLAALALQAWPVNKWLPRLLPLAILALAAWYGLRSERIVWLNHEVGMGFNMRTWRDSETVAAVKALPADAFLVTNEETAVLYLTGRASYPVKEIYRGSPLAENLPYGAGQIDETDYGQLAFRDEGAVLILFDSFYPQLEGVYGAGTEARVQGFTRGLRELFDGPDGAMFLYR